MIGRMEIRIEPDPEIATTQLLNGAADWVLDVRPDLVSARLAAERRQIGQRRRL